MRFRPALAGVVALAVCMTLAAPMAQAAFPGAPGKIAYVSGGQVWAVDPDGSNAAMLVDVPNGLEAEPAWSADGERIAFEHRPTFGPSEVWVANSDGSAPQLVIADARTPTWSPDGQRIAFARPRPSAATADLYTIDPDGTDLFQVTQDTWPPAMYPSWSPDGTKIATDGVYWYDPAGSPRNWIRGGTHPDWSPYGDEIAFRYRVDDRLVRRALDGSFHVAVSETTIGQAAFSPDGTELAYWVDGAIHAISYDGTATRKVATIPSGGPPSNVAWQPIPAPPPPRYVRPRGATPLLASLVPAYRQCESPNREHGPPLAFGSCGPPEQTSTTATVGTPDANGSAARSVGFVSFEAVVGDPGTTADEADVAISVRINDVRRKPANDDYTFALDVPLSIRLTDGGPGAVQTTMPEVKQTDALWYSSTFRVPVPCAATADPAEGGLCSTYTSADAIFGAGAVTERNRAIWQLDQVRVFDAGPDGYAETTDDNELFAVQGLFVP